MINEMIRHLKVLEIKNNTKISRPVQSGDGSIITTGGRQSLYLQRLTGCDHTGIYSLIQFIEEWRWCVYCVCIVCVLRV